MSCFSCSVDLAMNVPSGFQPLRPGITIWEIFLNKNSAWDELNVRKREPVCQEKGVVDFPQNFFKKVELQKGIRAAHPFVGVAHKEKFLCES